MEKLAREGAYRHTAGGERRGSEEEFSFRHQRKTDPRCADGDTLYTAHKHTLSSRLLSV